MKGLQDTKRRDKLLAELQAGKTVTEASRSAGLSRRQAYRWRDRDPRVKAAWPKASSDRTERRRKQRERDETLEDIAEASTPDQVAEAIRRREVATAFLEQLLASDEKGDSAKVSAAKELVRIGEAAFKASKSPAAEEPEGKAAAPTPTINLAEARARLRG